MYLYYWGRFSWWGPWHRRGVCSQLQLRRGPDAHRNSSRRRRQRRSRRQRPHPSVPLVAFFGATVNFELECGHSNEFAQCWWKIFDNISGGFFFGATVTIEMECDNSDSQNGWLKYFPPLFAPLKYATVTKNLNHIIMQTLRICTNLCSNMDANLTLLRNLHTTHIRRSRVNHVAQIFWYWNVRSPPPTEKKTLLFMNLKKFQVTSSQLPGVNWGTKGILAEVGCIQGCVNVTK